MDEGPCDVCGKPLDDCICHECPVCQDVGNPDCYGKTGCAIEKTPAQLASYAEAEKAWEEAAKAQARSEAFWSLDEIEAVHLDDLDDRKPDPKMIDAMTTAAINIFRTVHDITPAEARDVMARITRLTK